MIIDNIRVIIGSNKIKGYTLGVLAPLHPICMSIDLTANLYIIFKNSLNAIISLNTIIIVLNNFYNIFQTGLQ